MCYCDKPTRETDPRRAPALAERDTLIFDEPGRCQPQVNGKGWTDYHSHHFRLIQRGGIYRLLVRHGGGDEAVSLGGPWTRIAEILEPMDSDARYLMLHALYNAHLHAARNARDTEGARWKTAAAEGRLRTRKVRGQDLVKVWIEERAPAPSSTSDRQTTKEALHG